MFVVRETFRDLDVLIVTDRFGHGLDGEHMGQIRTGLKLLSEVFGRDDREILMEEIPCHCVR